MVLSGAVVLAFVVFHLLHLTVGVAGPDFAGMVKDAVASTEARLQSAEQMTGAAAAGKTELVDVVTAVASAEVTLQTVVAVRDEVIRAYQDIFLCDDF